MILIFRIAVNSILLSIPVNPTINTEIMGNKVNNKMDLDRLSIFR